MKKIVYTIIVMVCMMLYTSCEHYETYGDKKEKERNAISEYIAKNNIKVIDETTFQTQGETTNLDNNEYVLLSRSGVYMQIVRKGCGSKLEEKKTVNILCRFEEYNILQDTMLLRNNADFYIYSSTTGWYNCSQIVDKMSVTRNGTTITASFVSGLMRTYHSSSTSVPAGWLVPLNYINIGRPIEENDQVARVRLIVPHSQGTADASSSVYPCYYDVTYEREK